MADRRALIVGTFKGAEDTFSPQRVTGLTQRLSRLLGSEGRYLFSSIEDKSKSPDVWYNRPRAELIALFEGLEDVTPDTELLFYFVGHSMTVGDSALNLFLCAKKNGDPSYFPVSELLEEIRKAGFKKVVLIIDGCHAFNAAGAVNAAGIEVFGIFSGEGYAFNGNFTEGVIRTLEQKSHRNDQRVDRRRGGFTYQKLFDVSRANLRAMIGKGDAPNQTPKYAGNYGHALLAEAPPFQSERYNSFASNRSIYARIHSIMSVVDQNAFNDADLINKCRSRGGFLLKKSKGGNHSFVSPERFHNYLDFLIGAKLLVKPQGTYSLTQEGKEVLAPEHFNGRLLGAIESNVFPKGLTFGVLEDVIKELLDDLIPPTPSKIEERLQITSETPIRITPRLRFAFQLLPSTGRFLKGSADALFIAETAQV